MSQGRLYIVSTPIGNLEDFSARAERVLREVALVAAEDTRHSRKLLDSFGLRTPMQALHEHNETQVAPQLVSRMLAGEDIALISDAGTPLISDPGYNLVSAARQAGLDVQAVPGASAILAALAVAGLPTDRFVFEGFLPAKRKARRERLMALKPETRTLVIYESSHRIADCASDLADILEPQRLLCIARELTKLHEESERMSVSALPAWLAADAHRQRGEFVVILAGSPATSTTGQDAERLLRCLLEELPPTQAARLAAKISGEPRQSLYKVALSLQPESPVIK